MKTAYISRVFGLIVVIVIGTFGLQQSIFANQGIIAPMIVTMADTPTLTNETTLTPEPTRLLSETFEITSAIETESIIDQTTTASIEIYRTEQFALTPVTSNASWTPVKREFDGVTMVLVPVGCFMMGNFFGNSEENPVQEQCLNEAFWIDETEVTQADFMRLGGVKANKNAFEGDNRPVERITLFEARDFCELRGMRLPTEREWEYAARGPEGWVYPWGSYWDDSYAVWRENSGSETASVGSIPAGASWVGALDMSGNVWEWTSSLYKPYPYDASDGREDAAESSTRISHVVRGGSFSSLGGFLRGTYRIRPYSFEPYHDFGFRCASSASFTNPQ